MRWMRGLTLGGVAMLAGCLRSQSHSCPGSDIVCPENLTCTGGPPLFCATADEIAACTGVADGVECTTELTSKGRCSAGACTPCFPEDLRCRYPAWVAMTSPTINHLNGIWAAGAEDIYAVGDAGTVIHYDGTAWRTVTTQFMSRKLSDVWGTASSDVYILGDAKVFHYTGTGAWPNGPEMIQTTTDIFGIGGSASDHVVAVGLSGTIRRFTGGGWTAMPDPGVITPFYAAWGTSATSFYAAGSAVYHFDGASWTVARTIPSNAVISAMSGTSGGDVFAVGHDVVVDGIAARFVPFAVKQAAGVWSSQVLELPPPGINEELYGVWAAAENNAFAVGTGGLVLHHDGASWHSTRLGMTLYAVTGTSSGDVFAVGEGGAIWRYSYAP